MAEQVILCFSDRLVDFLILLTFALQIFVLMRYWEGFSDGILEIRSVKPISFPARCLIVKLKGNNLSTHLVNLL